LAHPACADVIADWNENAVSFGVDLEGTALRIEGDHALARQLPGWIRLDKVVGRDFRGINRQRADISPGSMHAAISQREN
jgi:hypothetical protein